MSGVVQHWRACKENDLIPVLGVEAYFQPKFNKKEPKRDSFHLCLFAENLQGYKNLNRIMSISNLEQKYFKPICDFDLLEKYSEGIICTSGCIGSFISQTIAKKKYDIAEKAIKKFISIFGKENFYIEIQPYKLDERSPDEKNLQERVNIKLIEFAKKLNLKMILTSDSHYGNRLDYDTYCKMHEMKGSGEFNDTYKERFMPAEKELMQRFMKMHGKDFKDAKALAIKCVEGLNDIEQKVDPDILSKLPLVLPRVSKNSAEKLKQRIIEGLKIRGKDKDKRYLKRCIDEYKVVVYHGFEDYFLIVQDYVKWAKARGILVGPGRGSVCNSLMAYALEITEVDSLFFDIDFTRFLRMDKKKLPDIDLDFETDRRDEVIEYIVKKYPGKAAQICSYGLYKVDNTLNDLFKVCGVTDEGDKKQIKQYVKKRVEENEFDYDKVQHERQCREFNRLYDNIILHFSKMYMKVKYIGTHAAGVAVVGGELLDYTSVQSTGSKDKGTYKVTTSYDLNNLEAINVIKFDMLGLRTLSITKELEEMTDECFSYEWFEDDAVYEYFRQGKTDGIFQFERDAAKNILRVIDADCFDDVTAASALNRPGPLSLKMHEQYGAHKANAEYDKEIWSKYTNKTYGTIVYQEQTLSIAKNIGLMDPSEADKILKFMKGQNSEGLASLVEGRRREEKKLKDMFFAGAKESSGLNKQQADELFEKLLTYTFNQGHAIGYSMISLQQMYYKVHHPELFWYVTLKYAANDSDLFRLKIEAVREGNVILLPHVNYEAKYSIVTIEGDNALAEGLSNIKNVGDKAAQAIEEEKHANGKFKNKEDFIARLPKGKVNAGVMRALEENGALIFDKTTYFERVKKYNSSLYMKGGRG